MLIRTRISFSYFFLKILFICRQRGREGEREGEKHCVIMSRTPPTGDLAHSSGMCPDWELDQQPFSSQASTQSTEPHHPGLYLFCMNYNFYSFILVLFVLVLSFFFFFFFFISLVKGVLILFLPSRNQLLYLLTLWIVLLVFMLFNFALILIIFFFYFLWDLLLFLQFL